jgi:ubiquinone biosynthesis accessory factor UbiJ
MDVTFSTAARLGAEKIINAALAYDPSTGIALSKLAPQVLSVTLTDTGIHFFLVPNTKGVSLLGHFEGEVSAQICGTAPALFALLSGSLLSGSPMNLKDTGVSITGNSLFVAELQQILKKIEIDWEEILCGMVGDLIGHSVAQTARSKINWAKQRAENLHRLTSEFLTEESHLLPSKPEVNFFNQQVDNIRLSVDRLEARIHQITDSLKHSKAPL